MVLRDAQLRLLHLNDNQIEWRAVISPLAGLNIEFASIGRPDSLTGVRQVGWHFDSPYSSSLSLCRPTRAARGFN